MKILFVALILVTQVAMAQSTRPNTPYWQLVDEVERTGLVAYERFNWSEQSLQKILKNVPTISNLLSEIGRRKIVYKIGGENEGNTGFTTLLKNGDLYVQVYYAKHLKNIDVVQTLGHELTHAYHIDSDLFYIWQSNVRNNKKAYAQCVSEMGAYTWSAIYAESKSKKDWYIGMVEENQKCMKDLSK